MGLLSIIKMKKSIEFLSNCKELLKKFLELPDEELLAHYEDYYAKAIKGIYKVANDNELRFNESERLNSDYLFCDILIVTFYQRKDGEPYHRTLKEAKRLPYPKGNFELMDEYNGKYKDLHTKEIHYSKRIAIDYTLKAITIFWLNKISEIQKLLQQQTS